MASDSPASKNLEVILDEARAALDSEWQLANRLDEKARGQATLAGAWFAVTQAVAAAAFAAHIEEGWAYALVVGLVLQAVWLVRLLAATAMVWKLRTERGAGVESVKAMKADAAADSVAFASKAVDFYITVLDAARRANAERADAFDDGQGSAMYWWWRVLVIGLIEIGVALLAQTPI